MKKIIIFCICFLITINAYAQTVIKLKDGARVEGKLVEKTDDYIKVNAFGVTLTYRMDEVKSIDLETKPQTATKEKAILDVRQQGASPNTEDTQKIQKALKGILMGIASQDLDSTMQHISPNYHDSYSGKIIDYAEIKFKIEKRINNLFQKYSTFSISGIKIVKLDFEENNRAFAEIEYVSEGFNIGIVQWVRETNKWQTILAKENDLWKVILLKVVR